MYEGKERSARLDYFGARYYDGSSLGSSSMRWISPDSLTTRIYDQLSLDKYTYVRNDPVNLVDPDGRAPEAPIDWMPDLVDYVEIPLPPHMDDFNMVFELGGNQTRPSAAIQWKIDNALELVLTALESNPDCASLFDLSVGVTDIVENMTHGQTGSIRITTDDLGGPNSSGATDSAVTYGIPMHQDINGVSTYVGMSGADIIININQTAPINAGYGNRLGLNDPTNLAVTILHELGHAVWDVYGQASSDIIPDIDDLELSAKNSKMIAERCFK